jgi:hypothetical protein
VNRGTKLVSMVVLCVLGALIFIPFASSLATLASVVQFEGSTPGAWQSLAGLALLVLGLYGPVRRELERRRDPQADNLEALVGQLERAAAAALTAAASAEAGGISKRRVRKVRRSALRAQQAGAELTSVRRHFQVRGIPADVEDLKETSTWRHDAMRDGRRALRRTQATTNKVNAIIMSGVRQRPPS